MDDLTPPHWDGDHHTDEAKAPMVRAVRAVSNRRKGWNAMDSECLMVNCRNLAPDHEAMCAKHRFPKPARKDGGEPCGECHLQPGERCDICGAKRP